MGKGIHRRWARRKKRGYKRREGDRRVVQSDKKKVVMGENVVDTLSYDQTLSRRGKNLE